MKHVNVKDVPAEDAGPGTKDAKIRWVVTEKDGAPTFIMRHFEIGAGGCTPLHEHAWEHELFIISGAGAVVGGAKEEPFKPGDAIFIPGGEKHQFKNTGKELVSMLCFIPARKL